MAAMASAQPPFRGQSPSRAESTADGFVTRMMVFDENHDGKLTRGEMTDDRLLGLFDRADANHDGVVTKEELKALYAKESAEFGGRRGGPFGSRGPGGPPDGMMPQPGQILPEMAQRILNLTPQQKTALGELQHEVDTRLDQLLTPAQKLQLKGMGSHGPAGFMPRWNGPGAPTYNQH